MPIKTSVVSFKSKLSNSSTDKKIPIVECHSIPGKKWLCGWIGKKFTLNRAGWYEGASQIVFASFLILLIYK